MRCSRWTSRGSATRSFSAAVSSAAPAASSTSCGEPSTRRTASRSIALRATAKDGAISCIVPRLPEGAAVTTPRMDVHYLVTEHGVTNLKGRSTRERALAIIELADPKFRDGLLREAEGMFVV